MYTMTFLDNKIEGKRRGGEEGEIERNTCKVDEAGNSSSVNA